MTRRYSIRDLVRAEDRLMTAVSRLEREVAIAPKHSAAHEDASAELLEARAELAGVQTCIARYDAYGVRPALEDRR